MTDTEDSVAEVSGIMSGLLMPMQGFNLVLPNECVAEIIAYEQPASRDKVAAWMLGDIQWRGMDVPVISYELLSGKPTRKNSPIARIAIMNALGGDERLTFFGIVTQGIPSLMRLMSGEIERLDRKKGPADVMVVAARDGQGSIPNLLLLEKMLLKQLYPG